jgi:monovalent cation:H+ antiporter-2, CPA2 family
VAVPSLLLDFAIVLIAAEIGATAFRFLRLPRVVGMLVAGILVGPFTPGYAVDPAGIADLAVLGAVFLMFSIGLSFDIRTFRTLGWRPFLLGGLGVGASFGLGLALGVAIGWGLLPSMFLGLVLTSTSSTLGLKFLADFGLTSTPGVELVTAAILIDDVMALILMTIAVGVATPAGPSPLALFTGLGILLALAILLVWLGSHALPRILRATDRVSPSSTMMVAVSLALLISFAFALLGLPPLVGAFFAGSIVASTEYGGRVSRQLSPVTAIFMGVFFASIGFLIDPGRLPGMAGVGFAAIGIAVVGKVVPGVLALPRLAAVDTKGAWRLSTVLVPRAEISLIIAQYGILIGAANGADGVLGTADDLDLLAVAMMVMLGTALLPGLLVRIRRGTSPGPEPVPSAPRSTPAEPPKP